MRKAALLVGFAIAMVCFFCLAVEDAAISEEPKESIGGKPADVAKQIEEIKEAILSGKQPERIAAAARMPEVGVERLVNSFDSPQQKRRFVRRLLGGSWSIEASSARLKVFLEILKDEDQDLRLAALKGVEMLTIYGDKPETLDGLLPVLKDERENVSLAALRALQALGKPGVVSGSGFEEIEPNDLAEALLVGMQDRSPEVRAQTLNALPDGADSAAVVKALRKALDDPAPAARSAALGTLMRLDVRDPKAAKKALAMSTTESDFVARRRAIRYLGKSHYEPAFPTLIKILTENKKLLDHPKEEGLLMWSKVAATAALADFGNKEAGPALVDAALNDERYAVQWRAARAYQVLMGKDLGFFEQMAKAEGALALKTFRLWYLTEYEKRPEVKAEAIESLKKEIAALEHSSRFDIVLQLLRHPDAEAYKRGLNCLDDYGVSKFFEDVESVETMRQLAKQMSFRPVAGEYQRILGEALFAMLDSKDQQVLEPAIFRLPRLVKGPDPERLLEKFEVLAKSDNAYVARLAQMNLPYVRGLAERKKQREQSEQQGKETPGPEPPKEPAGSGSHTP